MKEFSFENIIKESAYAYAVISTTGDILWRNNSFDSMFRYSKDDSLHVKDICPETDTVGAVMKALLAGYCENFKMDKRYLRKDKSIFWGRVAVSLVKSNDGLPMAYFISVEDITAAREKSALLRSTVCDIELFLLEKMGNKPNS